jgi:hypothetical protein
LQDFPRLGFHHRLLVRDVDSPLHPFQKELGFDEDGCKEVAVPETQRLVLDYVSALIGAGPEIGPGVFLETRANGALATHHIPVTPVPHSPGQFTAGQDVRIYADAGSTVSVCAHVSPASAPFAAFGVSAVTISGHLEGPAPVRG